MSTPLGSTTHWLRILTVVEKCIVLLFSGTLALASDKSKLIPMIGEASLAWVHVNEHVPATTLTLVISIRGEVPTDKLLHDSFTS